MLIMPFKTEASVLFSVPTSMSTKDFSRVLDVWRIVGCFRVQLGILQAFLSGQSFATCLSDKQPKQSLLDARKPDTFMVWLLSEQMAFLFRAWVFWQNGPALG